MAAPTHHDHVSGARLAPEEAVGVTRGVARLSVAVALILVSVKLWAWLVSGSVALLSSFVDSGLDLAASIFTLLAVGYAAQPPDRAHRYGHGKAEAFAGLFQAGLVAVSAVLIVIEAIRRLIAPQPIAHGGEGLVVMIVSIALTMWLVWMQSRALARTGSLATAGDRAHYMSDLATNLVAMLGLAAGAFFQITWIDAGAGLFIAAWLGYGAWEVARGAADHLMDREMADADRERIRALALEDANLRGVHDLRTRMSGPIIHIQFHADLDPEITLDAAHKIVVAAENRIREAYPAADVIIHPDPGDRAEPHGHEYFSEGLRAGGG